MLELRIGIVDSPKELSLEVDQKQDEVKASVEAAVNEGSSILWVTDRKGKQVGVPAGKVAYVEIDTESAARSVGFTP
ncbi:MAG: DUF3107 domain-containing protein [Actinomycetota bacterium]